MIWIDRRRPKSPPGALARCAHLAERPEARDDDDTPAASVHGAAQHPTPRVDDLDDEALERATAPDPAPPAATPPAATPPAATPDDTGR